jgi:NTP pyrophosphatase (non-canonical NTP hydrolase)
MSKVSEKYFVDRCRVIDMADSVEELQQECDEFVNERDWEDFHTPKNVAMSISIESSELLELFQWHDELASDRIKQDPGLVADVEDEVADVVIYCMTMANELDIDLGEAISDKIERNKTRFDFQTSKQIHKKRESWQK